jgi:peroxiredoxin
MMLPKLLTDSRRWRALLIAVITVSSIWIYLSRITTPIAGSTAPPSPQIGFSAPDFTLDDLNGQPIKLSDLRGKVVLINLWASWCPPCRAEMAAINNSYTHYADQGFIVLGLNTTFQDDETAARAFAQSLNLSFSIIFDRDGVTSRRYRLQAMPTSFFVGRDGVIRDIVLGGPMTEALLTSKIQSLLAEK